MLSANQLTIIGILLGICTLLLKMRHEIQAESADSAAFRAFIKGELKLISFRVKKLEHPDETRHG